MSIPTFEELKNNYNKKENMKLTQDNEYISKVIKEHYSNYINDELYTNDRNIVSGSTEINIFIRQTDMANLHYPHTLCNQMNKFINGFGYKFKTTYLSYTSMYDRLGPRCVFTEY